MRFNEIEKTWTNLNLICIQEQKWIVAIVSMVPIYATESVRLYYYNKHISNLI